MKFLIASLLLTVSALAQVQKDKTVEVTFYYPRNVRPSAANVVTLNMSNRQNNFPMYLYAGDKSNVLMTLRPETFVTIRMKPGTYQFGSWKRAIHIDPTPITIGSEGPYFLRMTVPQGWRPDGRDGFHLVNCEQAAHEAEHMAPLAATQIKVPMSQVIDHGAYLHLECPDNHR